MPTISFFLFSTSSFLSRKLYHSNCGNDFFFHTHAYAKIMSGPFTLAPWVPSDTVQMVAHLTVLWWHFTNLRTKKKLNVLNVMVAVSETYNENVSGDWNLWFFFKLSICYDVSHEKKSNTLESHFLSFFYYYSLPRQYFLYHSMISIFPCTHLLSQRKKYETPWNKQKNICVSISNTTKHH